MDDKQKGTVEAEAIPPSAAKNGPFEAAKAEAAPLPKEIGGRAGLEPTRYGDWEVRGLTSDF